MNLFYDGSFEGFLSLVHEVYHQKINVTAILKKSPDEFIFDEVLHVETDLPKAHTVFSSLKTRFSKDDINTIVRVFLCDSIAFEMRLLEFIILGFRKNENLQNINYPSVFYIKGLEQEHMRLTHKMLGFVRFEELEDKTLYAKIETKFNILMFLGKHFSKRLGNNHFIIHDIKRHLAYVKHEDMKEIRDVASFDEPLYSQDEAKFKSLWKNFFHSVAITNRTNTKLQKNLVPLVYRTYMSEFHD